MVPVVEPVVLVVEPVVPVVEPVVLVVDPVVPVVEPVVPVVLVVVPVVLVVVPVVLVVVLVVELVVEPVVLGLGVLSLSPSQALASTSDEQSAAPSRSEIKLRFISEKGLRKKMGVYCIRLIIKGFMRKFGKKTRILLLVRKLLLTGPWGR